MIRVIVADNSGVIHDIEIVNSETLDADTHLCRYTWRVRSGLGAGGTGTQTLHHQDDGAAALASMVMEELADELRGHEHPVTEQEAQAS